MAEKKEKLAAEKRRIAQKLKYKRGCGEMRNYAELEKSGRKRQDAVLEAAMLRFYV